MTSLQHDLRLDMTDAKHTPGPWFLSGSMTKYVEARIGNGFLQEVASVGPTVADAGYGDQQMANARLIAAAPELLEALQELLIDMKIAQTNMQSAAKRDPAWEGCADAIQPRVDAAIEVIAKATGG